jgi:restriction endonuclease S subunit
MKLSDVCKIDTGMDDADFWLQRAGSEKTVGKPHENVDLQDIGIKVKDTTVCHPKFLYYWFELLYMQGNMARLAEGQSIKSLSIKTIANIEIQVQQ